jgi:tetratricopeptide (TPR) repeat protein
LLALTVALGVQAEPEARMKKPKATAQPATGSTVPVASTTEAPPATGAEPASQTSSTSTALDAADKTLTETAPAEPEIDMRTSGEIEEENAHAEALRYEEAVRHYYLGHFYQDKWDLNLATTEYDQAISYSSDLKIAHRDLCWVSILSGNLPRAVAEFMMVVGLGEPVPYSDAEKTDLNHRALALHYKKGLEYARAFDWKNSQNELNWALTYDANDWAVHRSLAFVYASQGNYKEAEEEYQEALTLRPADPSSTHADLAFVLFDAGEKQAAQEELIEAVKSSPNAVAYHVDLGFVAETRGDYVTAVSELRKALELKPKHAGLWTRLGRLLERQGKATEAEAAYNMAINIDPTEIDNLKVDLERLRKNHS